MNLPPVVSRDEWLVARKQVLAREKEATPRSFGHGEEIGAVRLARGLGGRRDDM